MTAFVTSAEMRSFMSPWFCASKYITSLLLKNADAAAASFLRMMLRVFGRNSCERFWYAMLLYFESLGCLLLNALMLSSTRLR